MLAIAIIDDEPGICEVVAEAFEAPTVSIQCAMTAARGVEMLESRRFDIALIDVDLPDASGIGVAEIALDENIPVLLMTGDLTSIEGLIQLGFPFLEKPFSLTNLDSETARVLANPRRNIERAQYSLSKLRATIARLGQPMKDSLMLLKISRGLMDDAILTDAKGLSQG
jgi:DNA-binding NtrC family response regulator